MHVRANHETRKIVLTGTDGSGSYEIQLRWHEALNLGSMLVELSQEIEPPPPPGKRYEPSIERDR